MGWPSTGLLFLVLLALFQEGRGLYCHKCMSAMGGCGEKLNLMMFPWRKCQNSEFCIKVVEKFGSDVKITRACQEDLLKDTYHRLQMPVLQRHGYCEPARVNDPYNPQVTTDHTKLYCFCDDFDGCNAVKNLSIKFLPVVLLSMFATILVL